MGQGLLEAVKNGLTLETRRSATSEKVKQLRAQSEDLKQVLAEATLEVIKYKESLGL